MLIGMDRTEGIRDEFVALWGSMATFWGVSPATGRVYGWLVSQDEPRDADGIQEGLSMSRGAVSMACRELADWGLVHATNPAGTRRVSYRAEPDLEVAVRRIVETRKRREWDPVLSRLREWIPELRKDRSKQARVFRDRLESIEGLVTLADSMADEFLSGGVVKKLGLKLMISRARRKQR